MSESLTFTPWNHDQAGKERLAGPDGGTGHADRSLSPVDPQGPAFRRTATRADLLDAVYVACPSLSRHQAREIFEMALEEVSDALTRGECVKLRSFGLFNVREKRERIGRNPRTGQEVPIKPRRVLTFKASPVLLDHVNGRAPDATDPDAL